jgi:hypothetical protein
MPPRGSLIAAAAGQLAAEAEDEEAGGLAPGVSFYQVFVPGKVLRDAAGNVGYDTYGPFPDLGAASAFCAQHPGSLLAVVLVQFKAPAAPPIIPRIKPQ